VTVIAAGFDGGMPKRREHESGLRRNQPPAAQQTQEQTREAAQALAAKKGEPSAPDSAPARESVTAGARQQPPVQRPQLQFDDDDLDVPDFLK
jgi:cell division protein FtsZ